MLNPDLTNDALRFLKKRDPKQFLQILQAITQLCDNPRPTDSIQMETGIFRKDVGEFRIIYKFDNKVLSIAVIGNRNDGAAYKEHDRK